MFSLPPFITLSYILSINRRKRVNHFLKEILFRKESDKKSCVRYRVLFFFNLFFVDGTLEDWRSVFDVNVLGLCVCTCEAVRMMRETAVKDAVVIHVNSLAAERVPFIPGISVYPASKRAITALAMTLRHELAGTRIRVTVRYLKLTKKLMTKYVHFHFYHTQNISPGLVATEFMASYSMFSPEAMAVAPTLDPDDVAAAAIYVLSNPSHVLV